MNVSPVRFSRPQATELVPLRLSANRAGSGPRHDVFTRRGGGLAGPAFIHFRIDEDRDGAITGRIRRQSHFGGQFGASFRGECHGLGRPRCGFAGRGYRRGEAVCLEASGHPQQSMKGELP